jgi:plasmid maintenance system antidote protein VapI
MGTDTFETKLREALLESEMSYTEIANLAGITNASLSYFVNGKRSLSLSAASRLADCLGFELVRKSQPRKAR